MADPELGKYLSDLGVDLDALDRVASPKTLNPDQILSTEAPGSSAALLDQWGRIHQLRPEMVVGRQPRTNGVLVLDTSVSRDHCSFAVQSGRWTVSDLGSTNGTTVNDERVDGPTTLEHGATVMVGDVGFIFVSLRDQVPSTRAPIVGKTLRSGDPELSIEPSATLDDDEETTFVGMQTREVALASPTGGGGGVFTLDGQHVQLTITQFEFIEKLVSRMAQEADKPEMVRGFVPSTELIADLSWETSKPDESHTKQLVRRVRKALANAGLGNIVESRRRFGYRLRFLPDVKGP